MKSISTMTGTETLNETAAAKASEPASDSRQKRVKKESSNKENKENGEWKAKRTAGETNHGGRLGCGCAARSESGAECERGRERASGWARASYRGPALPLRVSVPPFRPSF